MHFIHLNVSHQSYIKEAHHSYWLIMLCSLDQYFSYKEWSLFIFRSLRGTKRYFGEKKNENIYFCLMKHALKKRIK